MCDCIIIFSAVSFFGKTYDVFMAIICDTVRGRLADCKYFLKAFMIEQKQIS